MHRCERSFFIALKIISQISVWLSVRRKRKCFIFNRMRLFYVKEKLRTPLGHGGKTIKKHMFQWKNLFKMIFLLKWKLLKFYENERKWEKIYKMLNPWLRTCRSGLVFVKKEIKDTKREIAEKYLENSWAVFNSIFMNNKGPSHTLKVHLFFFITFAKKLIIQIT